MSQQEIVILLVLTVLLVAAWVNGRLARTRRPRSNVFVEQEWRPGSYAQMRDRCERRAGASPGDGSRG